MLALLGVAVVARGAPPRSESANGSTTTAERREQRSSRALELQELPEPPDEIARWIKTGRVRFRAGGAPPTDDAASLNLAAVTSFKLNYDYDMRARWRVERTSAGQQLVLTLNIRDIRWRPEHVVWFREPPSADAFWEHSLVQHEFDHVRLSSDPRLQRLFEEALDKLTSTRLPIPPSVRVNDVLVRKKVNKLIEQEFARVLEMVEIRYRELDRLTAHGMAALPADDPLYDTLQTTAPPKESRERRSR